ncbi:MAG: hypothetical protein P4L74_05900 [Candidatus Doudnabacteria bacterium]|nr:hypothetical protein [Candidatus Doudnabacteria bacterium]
MKKYFLIVTIFLLAAACSKQPVSTGQNSPTITPAPTATPTPTASTAGWNSYNSPAKYGFSLKYSPDFGFSTDINQVKALAYIPVCDNNMVACAYIARDKYPSTNFDGAGVSVNILVFAQLESTKGQVQLCYDFSDPTNAAQKPVPDVTINGVDFKSATGGDAGAGHFEQIQVYRNFHNGQCFEISQHVASTNIGNYPAGTVTQFNTDEILQKLQGVVNTFSFAPSTASAAPMQLIVTGTTVCLPHKNVQPGQAQTMECAIGIKEDGSGKYYSLKNANPSIYDTNVHVQVTGKVEIDSASIYDTSGVINVANITKLSK